jgi:hypothetical protein
VREKRERERERKNCQTDFFFAPKHTNANLTTKIQMDDRGSKERERRKANAAD